MSPRAYNLGQRQAATDETRARIVAAARELLAGGEGFPGFTIDAVARLAGVARMTIYYQYNSKIGLIEAVCDSLAASGGMGQLAGAFRQAEPREALLEFIAVFGGFWDADRPVTRRLRGLGALDPEIAQVLRARDERRRTGAGVIIQRLAERYGRPSAEAQGEALDLLYTLTSFETFDTLAGATRAINEVTPIVQRLARAALGLDGDAGGAGA
jgi:AcrR family transcriptional regulator